LDYFILSYFLLLWDPKNYFVTTYFVPETKKKKVIKGGWLVIIFIEI